MVFPVSDFQVLAQEFLVKALDQQIHFNTRVTSYLAAYLSELKASHLVLERNYIDRDYWEDYSAYYVSCFHQFPRYCLRIHVFNSPELTEESFKQAVLSGQPPIVYLGFILMRPLPRGAYGRVCLASYEPNPTRIINATRDYEVNLYGLNFKIKSLAFQEQDGVTAACATSSLWSAFQKTSQLFGHRLKSSVSITQDACNGAPHATRTLPNREGLNVIQMADAIRKSGIEPYYLDFTESKHREELIAYFQKLVMAYHHLGIPIILLTKRDGEKSTFHAVTISGYKLGNTGTKEAANITDIMVHDDQLGPFAKWTLQTQDTLDLECFLRRMEGEEISRKYKPLGLIIPHYHKIRIVLQDIEPLVMAYGHHLSVIDRRIRAGASFWRYELDDSNNFKKTQRANLEAQCAFQFLTQPLPRYIWIATYTSRQKGDIFSLIYDATGVRSGKLLLTLVTYEQPSAGHLDRWLRERFLPPA